MSDLQSRDLQNIKYNCRDHDTYVGLVFDLTNTERKILTVQTPKHTALLLALGDVMSLGLMKSFPELSPGFVWVVSTLNLQVVSRINVGNEIADDSFGTRTPDRLIESSLASLTTSRKGRVGRCSIHALSSVFCLWVRYVAWLRRQLVDE